MNNQKELSFKNDVVFKYVFGTNTQDSLLLRKFLIKCIMNITLDNYDVSNPEIIKVSKNDKKIIQDIFIVNQDQRIGIEMQNSLWSTYQKLRFQYYAYRNITIQLIGEEKNYDKLKEYHLIVFIDDFNHKNTELIERLSLMYENGEGFKECLVHIHIIFLKEIDNYIKDREKLNEFEAMIYLIEHGQITKKYEEKEGVIKIMEKLIQEIRNNEEMSIYSLTELELENLAKIKEKLDRQDGERESLIDTIIEQIEIKYSIHPHWVENCTIEQLKTLRRLILTSISYQDLKSSI